MTFEVLLSCMHQTDMSIIDRSNLKANVLVINQCDVERIDKRIEENCVYRMISTTERGLSRSRNMAINNSEADICLIADDDEIFVDDLEKIIIKTFQDTKADIVAFEIKNYEKNLSDKIIELNRLQTLKISSGQIAFKRESLIEKGLTFDVNLGSGTGNGAGEENKLLWDAKRRGLKIAYCPQVIGTLNDSESQWFTGFNERYFYQRGATTRYYMGWLMAFVYNIYFIVTKYSLYSKDCCLKSAVMSMLKGYINGIDKVV